jgi:Zn-dependent protease with chaperone function|tara:strand:+ start:353 stop:568 length:216 start_codon:yes stop_codon:yes gene_type:complete
MFANLIKSENKSDVVNQLLMFALSILISTFILRLVWNTSLVKHISVLKPINSMLDAFILSVSIRVISGLDR